MKHLFNTSSAAKALACALFAAIVSTPAGLAEPGFMSSPETVVFLKNSGTKMALP